MINPFNRKVGCFETGENEMDFVVWAPGHKKMELKILASDASPQRMVQDEWGYWKITLPGLTAGTRYVYLLEDGSEQADPASVSQPEGVHGPSEVVNRSFDWTDETWKGLAIEDLIIYELHTGTFTKEGTFKGIEKKLDYLKALGINAIEIMPVAEFSGTRNWGYDGVFPFAIHRTYGKMDDLKALVDAAHKKEIAVLLDVVYNHMGPEGSCLKAFTPDYFSDKYHTPWGDALNFDGPNSDGVRNYFIQNALMWLDEFHIDGLRMDAVHALYDQSAFHIMEEFKTAVNGLEQRTARKKILIAEFDLNDPRYIRSIEKGGYGIDGQWIDEFHHALHSVLTGETNGYYEDFGSLEHLASAFRNSYVYNGIYSRRRKKIIGLEAENPYGQYIVFSQNHDHIGNRPLGDRLTATLPFEALKLAAATVLLSPYVPLLFMGEEYGEKKPFLYFADYEDKSLGQKASEGRRKEFSYFNFKDAFPDPLTEQTFENSKLSWHCIESPGNCLYSYYKYLIEFRKWHPVMKAKERHQMIVYPVMNECLLALERFNDHDRLLIVMNFGKEKKSYINNTGTNYRKIFDSSDLEWNGPQAVNFENLPLNQEAMINPLSVSVYQSITLL
jgi:maltooligosyltrehalose trehalohydrolase